MARIAFFTILLSLSSTGARAQAWLASDSVGRVLYLNANWHGVRQNSLDAMRAGHHAYPFIWRLAVAELELGYWRQAEKHFRQAIAMNADDPTAPALLAFLLRKTGREEEAGRYAKQPFRLSAGIDAGWKHANNDSLGTLSYQGAYVRHSLHRSASLTHAFSQLQQRLYWGDFNQWQYYVAYRQGFKAGWLLTAGAHVLRFSGNILFDSSQFNNGGEVYAVELRKQLGILSLSPQYSLATLYGRQQQQWGVRVSLHAGKFAAWRYDLNPMFNRDSSTSAQAFSQALHWFPTARWHFALNHYWGNGYNFQEQAGFLVNNGINLTRNRLGAFASFNISTRWQAFVFWQQETGTERFFNFDYRYQGLFGGIKFQP